MTKVRLLGAVKFEGERYDPGTELELPNDLATLWASMHTCEILSGHTSDPGTDVDSDSDPSDPVPVVDVTDDAADDAVAHAASEVIKAVADLDDVETLTAMRDAETAGKGRTTVLAAIEDRIAALKA